MGFWDTIWDVGSQVATTAASGGTTPTSTGSWTDIFSDKDVLAGLFEGGAGLAGGLLANDTNQQQLDLNREQFLAKQEQDRELAYAQLAASQANAGTAAETAKEIAKRQIAGRLASQYGDLVSRSSLASAERLKNKDVEIPQSISQMFGRVQGSLG